MLQLCRLPLQLQIHILLEDQEINNMHNSLSLYLQVYETLVA